VNNKKSFWVTNISKMNVSLTDLNLTIRTMTTVNLLDHRHYSFTENELKKSAESGSIFKKRDRVVVRKVEPKLSQPHHILIEEDSSMPSRERSLVSVKQEKYEELNVSDESFASEMADLENGE
jgi:hypothetical protein